MLNTSDTVTYCACNHLTDFALFFPPNNFDLFTIPIVITDSNFATLAFLCAVAAFYILWMVLVQTARCPGPYHRLVSWLRRRAILQRTPRKHLGDNTVWMMLSST